MEVYFTKKTKALYESFKQNKDFLSLSEINFFTIADYQNKKTGLIVMESSEKDLYPDNNRIIIDIDINKPFSIHTLSSLIKKKLSQDVSIGNAIFKLDACVIIDKAGKLITKLTEKESSILKYLIEKNSQGATSTDLLQDIWGYNKNTETTTVETHIYKLKNKLTKAGLIDIINTTDKKYYIKF
jgi:two-component SAPR family response regulator